MHFFVLTEFFKNNFVKKASAFQGIKIKCLKSSKLQIPILHQKLLYSAFQQLLNKYQIKYHSNQIPTDNSLSFKLLLISILSIIHIDSCRLPTSDY